MGLIGWVSSAIMDAKNRAQKEARDLRNQTGGGQARVDALDKKVSKAWEVAEKVGIPTKIIFVGYPKLP